MRATTLAERTILAAAHKWNHRRLMVKDATGAWVNLSDYLAKDWVLRTSWQEGDIDAPIAQIEVTIRRDRNTVSLSPFRGDSPANADGPLIDDGRDIQLLTATTAHGVNPVAGDWKLKFDGVIDRFDAANGISLSARDRSGELVDLQVEEERTYGAGDGTEDPPISPDVEDVMQTILDDWAPAWTLQTPASPGFLIKEYQQAKQSVYDAERANAGLIGWDVRYEWNDGTGQFELMFTEPDREATVPVWTFAPNRYYRISKLAVDRTNIRNVVRVSYRDAVTGARDFVEVDDAVSIARYGRRWMEISEGDGSPIDSEEEATVLANAALSDLSTPIAEKEVEIPYNWAVQRGDLLRFTANGVHYDEDQDLAVTSIRHTLEPGKERTFLNVRGKPAGFYRFWLIKGLPVPPIDPTIPTITLLTLSEINDADGKRMRVDVELSGPVERWQTWERVDDWPTVDGTSTGALDDQYLRDQFPPTTTGYDHSVTADEDRYVIAVAYSGGTPGPRAMDHLLISSGGIGSEPGTLNGIGVSITAIGTTISWGHNATVEAAAAGDYLLDIYRNDNPIASDLDPKDDVIGVVPDAGSFDDALVQTCIPEGEFDRTCRYQEIRYTLVLRNPGGINPDKIYSAMAADYISPIAA